MSEDFPRAPGGFAAGSRIAGYLLEDQIGRGGMAVVFRAHDERLDRTVALKILAPALADDEAFRQRFIRESRAAAAVDDPHIIPVFEAGEASGVLFIAMRYVRGGDVGTLVRRVGPLPRARMAGIVSQVASALDAAHARGLVHRDVKPTNMLLAGESAGRPDHVYLSDFGLSKTSLQVSGLTATGQFLGTLEYVAPEQIESKPVDGRADQYALACATYELLAGAPPFQRDTAMAVMFAQLSDPPPPLTVHRPDLSGQVDAVLAKALAKAPANRYQTCTEFAEALRSACGLPPYDTGPGAAPRADHPVTMLTEAGGTAPTAPVPGAELAAAGTQARPPSRPDPGIQAVVVPQPRPPQPQETVAAPPAGPASAPPLRGPSGGTGAEPAWPGAATPPPVAVPAGGTVVKPPPAGPPLTERLTAAGPAAGPPRRRTALMASATTLVVVAAAVVAFKLVTSGHPAPVHHHPPPSHSSTTTGASNCFSSSGVVNPAAFAQGPTLADTGGGNSIVEGAAFSPDGSELAVGDHDGTTDVWNTATFGTPKSLADPFGNGVQAVAFSCNGKSVAIADTGGDTLLWPISAPSSSPTVTDPGGQATVMAVAVSPNGKLLATGDKSGDAYLWNIKTHHYRKLANPGPAGNWVQGVAFSPGGTELATGDSDGNVYVWSTATGHRLPGYGGANNVQAVAFSPDGTWLAIGDRSGTTYLWDVRNHTYVMLTDPGPGTLGVVALAFSPDSGTLATGDSNGSTYLWNVSSHRTVRTLSGPGAPGVQAVAFSPDGHLLAVGFTNGQTYIWQS